jgi:hypothetical protein
MIAVFLGRGVILIMSIVITQISSVIQKKPIAICVFSEVIRSKLIIIARVIILVIITVIMVLITYMMVTTIKRPVILMATIKANGKIMKEKVQERISSIIALASPGLIISTVVAVMRKAI